MCYGLYPGRNSTGKSMTAMTAREKRKKSLARVQLVHMDIKITKQKDGGRPRADKSE